MQLEKAVATLVFFLMSENRHGNSPRVAGSSFAVRGSFVFGMRDEEDMRLIFCVYDKLKFRYTVRMEMCEYDECARIL